jgi:hypothetical protein
MKEVLSIVKKFRNVVEYSAQRYRDPKEEKPVPSATLKLSSARGGEGRPRRAARRAAAGGGQGHLRGELWV